jgi:hypothetical protein
VVIWCAAALLAVSVQVIPPSQNSTTSATDNLNTAHHYNHNFKARDESRIRQHSTTFGNNAEGTTDVATATSDTLPLPVIDFPAQHPHFCRIAPYPVYSPVPNIQTPCTMYQLPPLSVPVLCSSFLRPLRLATYPVRLPHSRHCPICC